MACPLAHLDGEAVRVGDVEELAEFSGVAVAVGVGGEDGQDLFFALVAGLAGGRVGFGGLGEVAFQCPGPGLWSLAGRRCGAALVDGEVDAGDLDAAGWAVVGAVGVVAGDR